MSSLDSDTEADLEQQLNRNLKQIQGQYADYVDCILTIVEENGVSAERLSAYLLNLCAFSNDRKEVILSDLRAEIESAGSVIKIFNILSTKYASFLDFDIFQSILKKYGRNESREDLNYPMHLEAYIKKHKIIEFIKINPNLEKLNDTSKKLNIKFGIKKTCNLENLKKIKETVANILGLQPSTLRLLSVKKGCVLVTFLIPASIAECIFTSNTVFTPEMEERFVAASALWFQCNGFEFDFRKGKEKEQHYNNSSGNVIM